MTDSFAARNMQATHDAARSIGEEIDDAVATIQALRSELASYRSLPLVPAAEYRRAMDRAETAERAADALTAELANARDKRLPVALKRALDYLEAELNDCAKEYVSGALAERRNGARAFLVEQGRIPPEILAMRQAWEDRQ